LELPMRNSIMRVYGALCVYGLRMHPNDLTSKESHYQQSIIRQLLEDNDADTLIDAIRFGMPNVWPYSEQSDTGEPRVFSAENLKQKLLEAKAAAAQARRAGRTPYTVRSQ